jgi:hypothetical protein
MKDAMRCVEMTDGTISGGRPIDGEVSVGVLCDLLEGSTVQSSMDLGSAVIHEVCHVTFGQMTLISTICGRAAIAYR